MNLVFGVASDHPTMFFERVAAENGRFTLFDDEFIDLSLLGLQLSCLATSTYFLSAAFSEFVQVFPLLHLFHALTALHIDLSTASSNLGLLRNGLRKVGFFESLAFVEKLVVALDALLYPCVMNELQVIIFLVMILEVILSS